MKRALAAIFCTTLSLFAGTAAPQGYPTRPVRIVVPFPAGGTTDIVARLVGMDLQRTWGQPVVVENRAGAGGSIGTELVAKALNDGYTLLMGTVGTLPNVPTMEEAAGLKGFDATAWFGLLAPAGTPREIVEKIRTDVAKVLESAEMRERFAGQGAPPVADTPEQVTAYIRSEIDKWTRVVKVPGAKID
jgi:tripartite-type tricarboxylate transporter receptor subunit TctC